jgi:hypothetical protein
LNSCNNFASRNKPSTVSDEVFQKVYNFERRHVRVQLPANSEKPIVDAFTGVRRRS